MIPRSTIAVLAVVATICIGGLLAPHQWGLRLTAEGGPVELASAVVLVVALLTLIIQLASRFSLAWLSAAALMLWALLRELDFQKRFTFRSIESIAYFVSPRAPWQEKLVVILIMLPFAVAGLHLLRLFCRHFPREFGKREPWTIHFLAAVALGIVGVASEKLLSLHTIEEPCELGAELLALLMILDLRKKSLQFSLNSKEPASCIRA